MTGRDASKIGATVIAAIIPPAISPDVLSWIRTTFRTVSPQDPMTEISGDLSFFFVLTAFLLLPMVLAFAFRFQGIPFWVAIVPWGLLVAIWLANKSNVDTNRLQFWLAYLGYFSAAMGFAAPKASSNRWTQAVWIPPMLFLSSFVIWPSGWDVFFE